MTSQAGVKPGVQAAYERLLEHSSSCTICLAVTEAGDNENLPCKARAQAEAAYREARRPLAGRR